MTQRNWIAFVVTGVTTNGKRFRQKYPYDESGLFMTRGINLWRGSKWREDSDGKRELLARVWN